jgi:hypothetical protein
MSPYCAHTRVPWNGEQCLQREFSFSLNEKSIFHFIMAKTGYFCEAATKRPFQTCATPIYKNTISHLYDSSQKSFMGISYNLYGFLPI